MAKTTSKINIYKLKCGSYIQEDGENYIMRSFITCTLLQA
jgi:hypothetical protein